MKNLDAAMQERLIRLTEENQLLRSALDQTACGRELINQQNEFAQIVEVSRLIVSELDLNKVFDLVAHSARNLVDADQLIVPMLNEARDSYTYMAALGEDADAVLNSTFPVHVGMCGWVLQNEQSLLFGEASPCWLDEKTSWEEGQQSALLVPLFGRTSIIGGISALGKRTGGSFTHHDLDLLTLFSTMVSTAIENAQLFANLSLEVAERKKAEEIIARALEEKIVLLSEVHHRVKNNMAVISSFLQMQSMVISEEHVKRILLDCNQRIKAMSLVHEKLYKSKNFSEINLRDYLEQLVGDLIDVYGRTEIETSIEVQDMRLSFDLLIPFGLIVNEIVSNSLKYAFGNVITPRITIELMHANGTAVLRIADNGCGFDPLLCAGKKTLGLHIIDALTGQLLGQIQRTTEQGVCYTISFPTTPPDPANSAGPSEA